MKKLSIIISSLVFLLSCNSAETKKADEVKNFITDFQPILEDGNINAVVEIPSGTSAKWETNKKDGTLIWDKKDGKPRVINYLPYPANYGMIPRTILSKESGGDGDPLDVIVLGASVERGSVLKSKLIGVLYLEDGGEQDDKLIAVSQGSPLYAVNSLEELDDKYKGISEILKLWFTNYKGKGKVVSKGFGDKIIADSILKSAVSQYENK